MEPVKLFIGKIVHSLTPEEITLVPRGIIGVDKGKIIIFEDDDNVTRVKEKFKLRKTEDIFLKDSEFLMPGFIDAHTHAPQFPNLGLGLDKELLDWLDSYTFPLESKYQSEDFAEEVYSAVVKKTLAHGTTTAVYFATIHLDSSVLLAKKASIFGQRALVGKVNMNINCPSTYVEDTAHSVRDSETFIKNVIALQNPLVEPAITPRFAITCDKQLLSELGVLAAKYNVHIQTHISENIHEVAMVKTLFPDSQHYTDVYEKAKLLGRKTLLAHAVYLTQDEIELIKTKKASVVHCPNSNIFLKSGLCNVRNLLNCGVNVALGTDVGGGCSPSILDAIRSCLATSISISFSQTKFPPLTHHEAFYLATLGGAIALDKENVIGNFTVGKDFDALLINLNSANSSIEFLSSLSLSEMVQKFLYSGDKTNIAQVYVNGKLVSSNG